MTAVAPTLQAFFTERLARQLQASPRTIASYRDTLRLLLIYVHDTTGKRPATLDWDDLDEPLITAFLDHLEHNHHNSIRSRNLRLTAIRSLLKHGALHHPEHAAVIARVLAIPPKRHHKRPVTFLTDTEARALIAAPDRTRWEGRRDHALLTLTIQTGLRVSELIGLNCGDVASAPARTSAAKAKAESNARSRSQPPRNRFSPAGSPSAPASHKTRCFPRAPADAPAATRSSSALPPTPPPPPSAAGPCAARTSTPTCSDTAARCHCCRPASTPQ